MVKIGGKTIGAGHPVYITAEIGINHNGDLNLAKELIDAASETGCDAVKFQKRTPDICTPPDQRDQKRETPWGNITYLEYRHKVEFEKEQYQEIHSYCRKKNIDWYASCWDESSVGFMQDFDPVCYKVASACLTDDGLLTKINKTGQPIILSTGMSTMEQISHAVSLLDRDRLLLAHCTSTYPCVPEEINLKMPDTLSDTFSVPIGYSGHEAGLQITLAAVAMGAVFVERHITLDKNMWGSDQSASIDAHEELPQLVRDIRIIEKAQGDGIKKVYESEKPAQIKLRRVS